MFSYFLVLTRIKEGYYEPYPEQNHFLRYHLLSIRNWLIQENSWQKLLDRFGFHSYPMPSALQLTFSLLPVGYSCSSSFPTLIQKCLGILVAKHTPCATRQFPCVFLPSAGGFFMRIKKCLPSLCLIAQASSQGLLT